MAPDRVGVQSAAAVERVDQMPIVFDYARFHREVLEGATKLFTAIRENQPGETLYGFALFADEGAMSLTGMANSEEAFAKAIAAIPPEEMAKYPDQEDYHRFAVAEWPYWDNWSALAAASMMLSKWFDDREEVSENEWLEFRRRVFDTCIQVLERLNAEAFFGPAHSRDDRFLHFALADSDYPDQELDSARRLNSPAVFSQYCRFWKSDY